MDKDMMLEKLQMMKEEIDSLIEMCEGDEEMEEDEDDEEEKESKSSDSKEKRKKGLAIILGKLK